MKNLLSPSSEWVVLPPVQCWSCLSLMQITQPTTHRNLRRKCGIFCFYTSSVQVLGQYLYINHDYFVHRLLFFRFSRSVFRRYGVCLQLQLLNTPVPMNSHANNSSNVPWFGVRHGHIVCVLVGCYAFHKNVVRTSQSTHASNRKVISWIIYTEITSAYCENRVENTDILFGQYICWVLSVKPGNSYNYH